MNLYLSRPDCQNWLLVIFVNRFFFPDDDLYLYKYFIAISVLLSYRFNPLFWGLFDLKTISYETESAKTCLGDIQCPIWRIFLTRKSLFATHLITLK